MKVLIPLLSGKESNEEFINTIASGADEVLLLQVIDKSFMNKTSAAMGEVMQYHTVLSQAKKLIGAKKKKCSEITEWGETTKKIINVAELQKVDKIFMVKQRNRFFEEVVGKLEKEKLKVEVIEVVQPEKEEQKKKTPRDFLNGLIKKL